MKFIAIVASLTAAASAAPHFKQHDEVSMLQTSRDESSSLVLTADEPSLASHNYRMSPRGSVWERVGSRRDPHPLLLTLLRKSHRATVNFGCAAWSRHLIPSARSRGRSGRTS